MKASVKVVLATVAIAAILAGCGAEPASTTPSSTAPSRDESSVVSSAPAPAQESKTPESSVQEQAQPEAPKEKQLREVDEVPQGSGEQSLLQVGLKERGPDFIEIELDPMFRDIEGDIFIKPLDKDMKPIVGHEKWTNQLRIEGLPSNTRILVQAQREGIDGKYSASNLVIVDAATLKEYQKDPVHAVFTCEGGKISITPSDGDSRLIAVKLIKKDDNKFAIPEGGHEAGKAFDQNLLIIPSYVGAHAETDWLKENGYDRIAIVAYGGEDHEARWCEVIINIDDLIAKGTIDTRDIVGSPTP